LSAALSFSFALFIWAQSFRIITSVSSRIGFALAMVASPDSMSSTTAISGSKLFDGFAPLAFKLSDFGG
jgi:hypothetical protein